MLPWTPRRWGAGEEQAPEKQGPSAGSDPGQAWDSGEEALREPRTTPQDRWPLPAALGRNPTGAHSVRRSQLSLAKKGYDQSPRTGHPWPCLGSIQTWSGEVIARGCDRSISVPPSPSPQPWSRRPSWARKEQLLPRPPPGLAAERYPGTPGRYRVLPSLPPRPFYRLLSRFQSLQVQPRPPVPLSPEMTWEVAPSRMTLLAPRNPNCEAKPGPRLVWVSWGYLWHQPRVGQGSLGRRLKLPESFLSLHRGSAVSQAPRSQARPCAIPHSALCTRQPQAEASGPV